MSTWTGFFRVLFQQKTKTRGIKKKAKPTWIHQWSARIKPAPVTGYRPIIKVAMTLVNSIGCGGPSAVVWLLLLCCLGNHQPAVAGESIFDNIINQLMSTAATAQNYLDTTAGPQQKQQQSSVEESSLYSVDITSSFLGNGLPTVASYDENTPFWNPFTWLKPRAVSIPYNPDTDLTTVSNYNLYRYKMQTLWNLLWFRERVQVCTGNSVF